jgi:glycosyltransferase involved in cell wall biosynthesis
LKVLLTGTSLLATYGGPAFSVCRLATALTEAGVDVGLWAADQSARTTPILPAESPVRRLIGTEAAALGSFGRVDVLHDNGIWLRHNHRLAKFTTEHRIPRIVSTHGMLEPWSMKYKREKKRLAWCLYQRRDLARASCLHTTAEKEAENVRALGLGVPVCIIPIGVDLPEVDPTVASGKCRTPDREGCKAAIFLGRIHPKKGLPMLIKAWALIRPPDWVLRIAGPDEVGHQAELEEAVSAARLSQVVSFLGPLDGSKKRSALFDANLLVLPTHSENFGMVIAEALAHGLPVLTTIGAPWPMVPDYGCGWWVAPTVEGIAEGLRQATSRDLKTLRAMGAKGRELVVEQFGWEPIAKQFISIYQGLVMEAAPSRRI